MAYMHIGIVQLHLAIIQEPANNVIHINLLQKFIMLVQLLYLPRQIRIHSLFIHILWSLNTFMIDQG